eukprot:scaffold641860_cov23-Prasinocladus_malaysianus.AAC.1
MSNPLMQSVYEEREQQKGFQGLTWGTINKSHRMARLLTICCCKHTGQRERHLVNTATLGSLSHTATAYF